MTKWKLTGYDDDLAAEYLDEATGEAYYHRPSLKPRLCWVCHTEYVSPGKIYCPECARLQHALLHSENDPDT
jgi:hypothetical protein